MFKNKFLFILSIAFTFVILTPLVAFAANNFTLFSPIGIKPGLSITQIVQSLTSLVLISAFLERALEIFFKVFKFGNKDDKERFIPLLTGVIGLGISWIGIRGLEPLYNLNNDSQGSWFRVVDFVLTGVIISGGTAGIHKILTSITSFLDVTKTSADADKVTAETKKVTADTDKVIAETKKVTAEVDKAKADQDLQQIRGNPTGKN